MKRLRAEMLEEAERQERRGDGYRMGGLRELAQAAHVAAVRLREAEKALETVAKMREALARQHLGDDI